MDKEFLVQLTNNLYRLSLLFPKKEPLRYKIREVADNILAGPTEKDIETLSNFLEVAMAQNWVSPSDMLAIKLAYDNLKDGSPEENPAVNEVKDELVEAGEQRTEVGVILPERQGKILDFLRENGRAQVWQIKQVMPDISKRTLRRDFEHLLKEGTIERIGERNDTFYQIKTIQS